ncbi:MAG: hypothetical protein ACYS21_05885 [Planctomycetota bacterium]|jgi:hypothetical protein
METLAKDTLLSVFSLGFILFLVASCKDRKANTQVLPQQFETLTVYDVDGLTENLDTVVLTEVTHVAVEKDVVQRMFRHVRYRRGMLVWKGGSLGVAKTEDGRKRYVAISYYGGLFKILDQRGYYEVLGESRKLFDKEMSAIIADIFIPARDKPPHDKARGNMENN